MEEPADGGDLEALVREHAALRRVATLVAREPVRTEVFDTVTRETGQLLGAKRATLLRVDGPDHALVVASWSDGSAPPIPVGHRGPIGGGGILGEMMREPRPVRIDDFEALGPGIVSGMLRDLGVVAGVGGPIIFRGALWGAVTALWPEAHHMPLGAEDRIAVFAELVSYAIENAEARDELASSRARLVEAADEARRRIERDLHDGAQQRLVTAMLELTRLDRQLDQDPAGTREILERVREHLQGGLDDLRDLARGIHPSVLTERGLSAALDALVSRSPLPIELRTTLPGRPEPAIEAAAYFLVSEALTNAAKHAEAETVGVTADVVDGFLEVAVTDDGIGGADPDGGSGLRGLVDRVEAVGGHLKLSSAPGGGTRLRARLPMTVLGRLNGG